MVLRKRSLLTLCASLCLAVPMITTVPPAGAAHPGADPDRAVADPVPGARVADTPTRSQIRRFHLTKHDLRRIATAQRWASTRRARAARDCRSGNDFRLVTHHGTGAFQLTGRQWRGLGGRRFGAVASDAPKFAQKLAAWTLFRRSGWQPLGCPTADWMGIVFHDAARTPVGRVLFPGTHDSGAFAIRVAAPCSDEVIAGLPPFIGQAAKAKPCQVSALSRAQNLSLGSQLRRGVRYLDMRVGVPSGRIIAKPQPDAKDPLQVPLVLHHQMVSQSLLRGLRQVLAFVDAHPTEQVILDFQHVDLLDPAQRDNRAINDYYLDALNRVLHTYDPAGAGSVCESAWTRRLVDVADEDLARVPIRRGWNIRRNLVVLMEDEMPASGCYRAREKAVLSLWPNTEDPAKSKADNDRWLAERDQRLTGPKARCVDADKQNWCGLFVNQLQLSLQTGTQVNCVVEGGPLCSLLQASRLVNDKVAGYLTAWTGAGQPTNISIVDFFERSDPSIVDRLIRLNWQRTGQL